MRMFARRQQRLSSAMPPASPRTPLRTPPESSGDSDKENASPFGGTNHMPKWQEDVSPSSIGASESQSNEIDFMPKWPSEALMISPFGHTNGRHDVDQNREPATPGHEGSLHADSDVGPLLLVESPEERVTKYLESLPETNNNIMARNTGYERKHGLLANLLIACCQSLIVGTCSTYLSPEIKITHPAIYICVIYFAVAGVLSMMVEFTITIGEGPTVLATAKGVIRTALMPLTMISYGLGKAIGYIGSSFFRGVRDGLAI